MEEPHSFGRCTATTPPAGDGHLETVGHAGDGPFPRCDRDQMCLGHTGVRCRCVAFWGPASAGRRRLRPLIQGAGEHSLRPGHPCSRSRLWFRLSAGVPPLTRRGQGSALLGTGSLPSAKRACAAAPLTGAGKVTITQYISGGFDYDYSCI